MLGLFVGGFVLLATLVLGVSLPLSIMFQNVWILAGGLIVITIWTHAMAIIMVAQK